MPEGLTANQLADITNRLASERHELVEQMRTQIRETSQRQQFDRWAQLQDPADYSLADLMRDMELSELDRETEQLDAIENAEVRIQKGTYGECIDCGTDIRPERLLAQPIATRCVDCQARYERLHATRASGNM